VIQVPERVSEFVIERVKHVVIKNESWKYGCKNQIAPECAMYAADAP
jgi:hypothetical protein